MYVDMCMYMQRYMYMHMCILYVRVCVFVYMYSSVRMHMSVYNIVLQGMLGNCSERGPQYWFFRMTAMQSILVTKGRGSLV